jgi:hypothetical protein
MDLMRWIQASNFDTHIWTLPAPQKKKVPVVAALPNAPAAQSYPLRQISAAFRELKTKNE